MTPSEPTRPPDFAWCAEQASARQPDHLDIRQPSPPSHPKGSSEVRLLIALVEVVIAHGTINAAAIAKFESRLLHEEARAGGRLSLIAKRIGGLSPEVMEVLAGPRPTDHLLGWWDEKKQFHYGLVGLHPRVCEALRLVMQGWEEWEVAREMADDPDNSNTWLAVTSIEHYMVKARKALRKTFGLTKRAPEADAPDALPRTQGQDSD